MKLKAISGIMLTLLFVSMLTLAFNIQPVKAEWAIYIRADGSVDPSTANITSVDNITYTFIGNINESIVVERDNIVVDGKSYTLQETVGGIGIWLTGRSNVTIKNMEIRAFYCGICVDHSSNNTIHRNNITANEDIGIWLYRASNTTISENNITNNHRGIWLDSGSSNNIISGNNMTNNFVGIGLGGSSNNAINGNNIDNGYDGLFLHGSSNNIISGNNITNNRHGIDLDESSGNTIYHNNFVDNYRQAYAVEAANVWDNGYPSGGNYWNDYVDVDHCGGSYQNETGSDGIWDHPYIIDENNRDNYPLALEHELTVSLAASSCILLGRSSLLKATVYNRGSSNETDVKLQLLINGSIVANVMIPELTSGSSHTLKYIWTPTVEGTYNVTAIAPPVPDEAVTNNVAMRDVSVVTTVVGTYVSVDPAENIMAVGNTFTINITVTDVEDLYCWQVTLYFDPTMLNFTAAWYPPDHVFAGKMYITVTPVVDQDAHGWYISYGCSLLGNETTFSGSGTLCQISFTGVAEGFSALAFSAIGPRGDTFLLDSDRWDISFEVTDGLIVVEELEGDLNLDGRVDMRDISLAAAAFGSYPGDPRWNPIADVNEDNKVDMRDLATIARNFGKTV